MNIQTVHLYKKSGMVFYRIFQLTKIIYYYFIVTRHLVSTVLARIQNGLNVEMF